ncbi:MAG: AI-2E family transporter [Acidobacteriota bacterium]|nr:AI-2E family transporter [Blastocatellia bacterium]MDW8411705.1 AI-2E family transporter [Acidobacteriota bacterium]
MRRYWQEWPAVFPFITTLLVMLVLGYALIEAFQRLREALRPVFLPLLISLAFAYILEPVVEFFERLSISRHRATVLTLLVSGLFLLAILLFLIPSLVSQISDIAAQLPEKGAAIAQWVRGKLQALQRFNPALYERLHHQVEGFLHDPSPLTMPVVGFVKSALGQFGHLTSSLLNFVLIPFFVYYILVDFKALASAIYKLVPERNRAAASELFGQIGSALRSFVRGQILVCTLMALLYVAAFSVLNVRMGFTLGVLSGFGHLVPYFGTAFAALLVIVFTAFDEPSIWKFLAVVACYPVIQAIEGFILTPRILGDKLELHPFLVLTGVIIGHHLFGIIGIVLAAPVMACAKIILSAVIKLYLRSPFYTRVGRVPLPQGDSELQVNPS